MAWPGAAHAHLMQTGLGGYYDGLTHLLITPSDLLLVVGLALLAGQSGSACARMLLVGLPLGWLLGGLIGQGLSGEPSLPVLTTVSFTVVGLLVALQVSFRPRVLAALALITGGLHGLVNGATINQTGGQLTLLGIASGVFLISVLVSAQVSVLRVYWIKIALRVCGSWIAAAGLLTLGWLAQS
ncbi:MAG TPA: HupE/UreJ family protein [Prochlorococcus sp.]|nr:HupE/UreJ family protein [Prochlorococcus sp.]